MYRPRGFSAIGHTASLNTSQDFQKKSTISLGGSYLVSTAGQQHNLRFGWQFNGLAHDINEAYKFDYIRYNYARPYTMVDGTIRTSACIGPDGALYDPCGYYDLRTPFGVVANVSTNRHALYFQDAWTIQGALTLNFGLRFEKEEIPSFSDLPEFSGAAFKWGFTDKVAYRLGFAYDVLGNAKLKLFGSWGWFYDAMKLEMAQGSFGGFKWLSHYYLMDDTTLDWTKIGGLSGEGTYPGTFLETRNWRIPSFEDLDPDLKPMRMTEVVAGLEYEVAPDYVVSFRYTRKNLDKAIEDVGRQTPAGEAYYITNRVDGCGVFKDSCAEPRAFRSGAWGFGLRHGIDYSFLMRYFLGFLIAGWMGFVGTLHAQDFTVFGGFQHPGTLTLSSGVGGVGSAIGVPSLSSPGDLTGFQIDPKDFGIFGVRLYRSAAPLGLEHTVAYSPNFIDSDGNAFLFSTNLRAELPAPIFRPYATAGGGLVHVGGSGPASFGTKFSFNYGGGLNVEVMAPVGLRFDVRMYSIRGVEDHTLNVLESSVGILVGF